MDRRQHVAAAGMRAPARRGSVQGLVVFRAVCRELTRTLARDAAKLSNSSGIALISWVLLTSLHCL